MEEEHRATGRNQDNSNILPSEEDSALWPASARPLWRWQSSAQFLQYQTLATVYISLWQESMRMVGFLRYPAFPVNARFTHSASATRFRTWASCLRDMYVHTNR